VLYSPHQKWIYRYFLAPFPRLSRCESINVCVCVGSFNIYYEKTFPSTFCRFCLVPCSGLCLARSLHPPHWISIFCVTLVFGAPEENTINNKHHNGAVYYRVVHCPVGLANNQMAPILVVYLSILYVCKDRTEKERSHRHKMI
jgi:hypothetical protein